MDPIESINLPSECQEKCKNDVNCQAFVHRPSSETCWLKDDITSIIPDNATTYVGPKVCPSITGKHSFSLLSIHIGRDFMG